MVAKIKVSVGYYSIKLEARATAAMVVKLAIQSTYSLFRHFFFTYNFYNSKRHRVKSGTFLITANKDDK